MARPLLFAAPLAAVLLGSAPLDAQTVGLDAFDWTLVGTSQGPNTQDATSIHVETQADDFCVDGLVYFETSTPLAGTVDVRLDWNTLDICHYDWPIFVIDGVHTKVEIAFGGSCYLPGTEFVSFDVPAGSTFGLGAGSSDCVDGQGIADWSEFTFTTATWIDQGGGIDPRLDFAFAGTSAASDAGWSVAAPGDVDGDGVHDVAYGRPGDGTVEMRSGATGVTIWSRARTGAYGRSLASLGDIDGDGVSDLAVGRPTLNRVTLESGATGTAIWTTNLGGNLAGWALAAMGDMNGDGLGDVAVAGNGNFVAGVDVHVLSGADGSVIRTYPALAGDGQFGVSVGNAGDLTGDGVHEVMVGSPGFPESVRVYDGVSSAELFKLEPPPGQFQDFGRAIDGAGDVNGDGVPDLLVGAGGALGPEKLVAAGAVLLYDGADGSLGQVLYGTEEDQRFGVAVLGGLDLNGDGSLEMAVSETGPLQRGGVSLRRIVGGQLQVELRADIPLGQFGYDLAASVDTSGGTVLVVGAPFDAAGGQVTRWSELLLGEPPRLVAGGFPSPGSAFSLGVINGPPSATLALILGASSVDLPFKGGVLVPSPDVVVFTALDPAGEFTLAGIWPASIPTSVPLWFQGWMPDPSATFGWSATNGLQTWEP